jgi:DNA-binding CsgD family transcriptional regulator
VLDLVARGLTNALVADVLGISEGTVEYHLTALFDKAGVCNRATLIASLLELARR